MFNSKTQLILSTAVCLPLFAPAAAHAIDIADSSTFTYKYEMDVDPVTQNLDLDGNVDWAAHTGTFSVAGGIATVGSGSRMNGTGTSIWQTSGINAASEWTLEIRARIRQDSAMDPDDGQVWGISTSDSTGATDLLVEVADDQVILPQNVGATVNDIFPASSPVGEFVTVRMTYDADGLHVYHNNVLLNVTPETGSNLHAAIINRLMIGGYSGRLAGPFDIDYLRLTEGAYAPIPEPASLALMGMGALMLVRRRR